jgi:hypothetical protein
MLTIEQAVLNKILLVNLKGSYSQPENASFLFIVISISMLAALDDNEVLSVKQPICQGRQRWPRQRPDQA